MDFPPPEPVFIAREPVLMVGIIADTHGLLRAEAVSLLTGCDGIIHAGDLGTHEVFAQLSGLAPTVAIRGNVDRGPWTKRFPETLAISVGGAKIYVLHDLHALAIDPVIQQVDLLISGHSHRAVIKAQTGVLYVNPGSAGPRRFSLPTTLVRAKIGPDVSQMELIDVLTSAVITRVTTARPHGSA